MHFFMECPLLSYGIHRNMVKEGHWAVNTYTEGYSVCTVVVYYREKHYALQISKETSIEDCAHST